MKKYYYLEVLNPATGKTEDFSLVGNKNKTLRRLLWAMDAKQRRDEKRLEAHEVLFSSLVPEGMSEDDALELKIADEHDTAEEAIAGLEMKSLAAALYSLKEEDRKLIVALFFHDMSIRDYAQATGQSRSTIQRQREDILVRLRKILE
jgi:DNA-directed RNA polymerase specialized sigma24 family protein